MEAQQDQGEQTKSKMNEDEQVSADDIDSKNTPFDHFMSLTQINSKFIPFTSLLFMKNEVCH